MNITVYDFVKVIRLLLELIYEVAHGAKDDGAYFRARAAVKNELDRLEEESRVP